MPSIGQTTRPGYVYDSATDTWIPIGIGPHTHASTDLSGVIANSIVDAKGDLITATADNTPARLAAGNNGESLVVDSSTATGLRWSAGNPQGNPLINSAFQVWQRGTSIAIASNIPYTADRWTAGRQGGSGGTVSRQTTSDTTNLPFIQYACRLQRDSGNTSTNIINMAQSMESINSIQYAGKTVTISAYIRCGANYSGGATTQLGLATGTGTDQNLISTGFTGAAYPLTNNLTPTTTWTRYTATGTLSSSLNQIGVFVGFTPSGTAGANDWIEITGVQIDVGSVALPYRPYAATLAGELAACQRYYYRIGPFTGPSDFMMGFGTGVSSTQATIQIKNPVTMRTIASSMDFSGLGIQDGTNSRITVTNATINERTADVTNVLVTVASGITQYRPYFLHQNNNSTGYIGFSAEL